MFVNVVAWLTVLKTHSQQTGSQNSVKRDFAYRTTTEIKPMRCCRSTTIHQTAFKYFIRLVAECLATNDLLGCGRTSNEHAFSLSHTMLACLP